ncbi:hypothetical protein [Kribbella kalugense]|uniref:Tachylectin n=1 Tax=Kribbella kalugense TaxID=2512221 RepID=A0A4R7ZWQ5_9ACTN|nr:hypothetical protein [Kribbella kalugense]TDW22543.1 hypothetical protein EV650_1380 [Kribbella kalugense]
MRHTFAALAGLALAVPALTGIGTATAAPAATACYVQSGGLTAGNDTVDRYVNATSPITVKPVDVMAKNPFGGRAISLSTSWTWDDDLGDNGDQTSLDGHVVSGGVMYQSHQMVKTGSEGQVVSSSLTRIGSGWDAFRTLTQSWSLQTPGWRMYALRSDGSLYRWNLTTQNGTEVWHAAGSYPGFSAVKAVTLLSRTSTYDTLLATTRGGALYSIHIPLTSPMKPVVKPLRTATWGGFEQLQTARCGNYGTVLLAIDKDLGAGYLYAVGHANGTATVINSLGKAPTAFNDQLDFSWASVVDEPLFGE